MPLLRALRDARIWKIIAMTFPAMMALYTLGFYLPTLIRTPAPKAACASAS